MLPDVTYTSFSKYIPGIAKEKPCCWTNQDALVKRLNRYFQGIPQTMYKEKFKEYNIM
jgi:hypothetical protein